MIVDNFIELALKKEELEQHKAQLATIHALLYPSELDLSYEKSLKWMIEDAEKEIKKFKDHVAETAKDQKYLDKLESLNPKTWEELSAALQETLVWTGYEECYIHPKFLKLLIYKFNLNQP